MAVKTPRISDFLRQVGELVGDRGLKGEVDKGMRALVQSALERLDMVSREEFEAQTEILRRTRTQVESLERELEQLTEAEETAP